MNFPAGYFRRAPAAAANTARSLCSGAAKTGWDPREEIHCYEDLDAAGRRKPMPAAPFPCSKPAAITRCSARPCPKNAFDWSRRPAPASACGGAPGSAPLGDQADQVGRNGDDGALQSACHRPGADAAARPSEHPVHWSPRPHCSKRRVSSAAPHTGTPSFQLRIEEDCFHCFHYERKTSGWNLCHPHQREGSFDQSASGGQLQKLIPCGARLSQFEDCRSAGASHPSSPARSCPRSHPALHVGLLRRVAYAPVAGSASPRRRIVRVRPSARRGASRPARG